MVSMNFIKQLIITSRLPKIESLRLRYIGTNPVEDTSKTERKRKPPSKELEIYFSSNEDLSKIKELLPARFLRKNRKIPDDLYLVDHKIAKEIASSLLPNILDPKKSIIETNPGLGFLTKELLDAGLHKIQVYESNIAFQEQILKLGSQYPGRITQFDTDFFLIWKLSYQDRHDNGDRIKKMLSSIKVKDWSEDPTMTIIGALPSSNFIRYLILSLVFQFGIMTRGRCELYLSVPPAMFFQLTAGPETGFLFYRASSVLFQLLFNYEILKKIPRKAFLPWYDTNPGLKSHYKFQENLDKDYFYLTRIEFKRELPVPGDRLQHLWYFVRYMMLSRKRRIIPCLEKWIPGCGARLIILNSKENALQNKSFYPDMDIFTEIGQLTAPQILNLYKEFSSLPEYTESPFMASMESALLKMENTQDLDERPPKKPPVLDSSHDQNTNIESVIQGSADLNLDLERRK